MGRIFRLNDPTVSIIYVSPYPLSADIINYFLKTLYHANVHDAESRLIFMYPNEESSFPSHTHLNKVMQYSPKTVIFYWG